MFEKFVRCTVLLDLSKLDKFAISERMNCLTHQFFTRKVSILQFYKLPVSFPIRLLCNSSQGTFIPKRKVGLPKLLALQELWEWQPHHQQLEKPICLFSCSILLFSPLVFLTNLYYFFITHTSSFTITLSPNKNHKCKILLNLCKNHFHFHLLASSL